MSAHLIATDYPSLDTDEITTSTQFTVSVPLTNTGDVAAGYDDRLLVTFHLDGSQEQRVYPLVAPGLEPHHDQWATINIAADELSAGSWQVVMRNENAHHNSEYHITVWVSEVE